MVGVLTVGCGGAPEASAVRSVPPGMPTEGALLRLPSDGGEARLYRADSLTPLNWSIPTGVPKIARALGTELEDRMVYAVDRQGRLIGLDLSARRSRVYLSAAQQLTATPDGAVLGLDSAHRALRFSARALATFRTAVAAGDSPELLRGPGNQVVAYHPASGLVQVLGEEGEVRRFDAPRGTATASRHGELLAVTNDSGVTIIEPASRDAAIRFVKLSGSPVTAAFSPSAHRLYVARTRGDVVVIDRFGREEVATIGLPSAPRELRTDRSGRWLLARPGAGDSLWVIDLVRKERALTLPVGWADDLPLIAGGRTLVVRDGKDVVAWELTGAQPTERTRLVGAADDVYLAIPWSPADQSASQQLLAESPEAVSPTPLDPTPADPDPESLSQPSPIAIDGEPIVAGRPVEPTAEPVPGAAAIYLQVSSSQNREWAEALAQQLRDSAFPARLLRPTRPGDPYRVVVGPYASRDEADAMGRQLGRPYFVLTEPPRDP